MRKPEAPSVDDETLAVEVSDIAADNAGSAVKAGGHADKPATASVAPTKRADERTESGLQLVTADCAQLHLSPE